MAMHEHLRREHQDVRDFLRGYVGGLIGRGGYGAVFALLVGPLGIGPAAACAALAGCAVTYAALRLLAQRRADGRPNTLSSREAR